MSKRTHFTTVTALPAGITRETVLDFLHNHIEMIDLNPLVTERHPIKPPPQANPEEFLCQWYSISDKINYLPGVYTGSVTFNGCFHDLPDGLQTHIYAPMGLDMQGRWTLGGSLPGEPRQPVEIGLGFPKTGLWLREDVNMKCNMMMTGFVKRTTKKAHQTLVDRLIEKSHLQEAVAHNRIIAEQMSHRNTYPPDYHTNMASPCSTEAPSSYRDSKSAFSPPPSDTQSVRSNSIHSAHNSYSYNHAPPPLASQQSSYNQHPTYNQRPSFQDPRYPPQNEQPPPPHLQQHPAYAAVEPLFSGRSNGPVPTHFTAELPSRETKTPVEIDSSRRF